LNRFAGYPFLIQGCCVGVIAKFGTLSLDLDPLDYLAPVVNEMAQSIERKSAEADLAELNTKLEQRIVERTYHLCIIRSRSAVTY